MEWWNSGIVPVKLWNARNCEAGGFVNSAVTSEYFDYVEKAFYTSFLFVKHVILFFFCKFSVTVLKKPGLFVNYH